jgi:DNA-binding MarR family transcriptional regulator
LIAKKQIIDNQENTTCLADELDLPVRLERVRSLMTRMLELELAQYGLTPEQASILHVLTSKGGSATNEEIANTAIRQYHSIIGMVNRMSKAGFVKKKLIPNKKKNRVSITEKGARMHREVPKNAVRMLFSVLSTEEKQQLNTSLQKTIDQGRNVLGLDHVLPFLQKTDE